MNNRLLNTKTKYFFGFLYVFLVCGVFSGYVFYTYVYQDYSVLILNSLPEVASFSGGLLGSIMMYVSAILFPSFIMAMFLGLLDRFNIIRLNENLRKNGVLSGELTIKITIVICIIGTILGASVYIAVQNRLSQAGYTRCNGLEYKYTRRSHRHYTLPQDCQRLVDEKKKKRER